MSVSGGQPDRWDQGSRGALGPGGRVVGVDLNPVMCAKAQAHVGRISITDIVSAKQLSQSIVNDPKLWAS
jgi:hypothetical protein